MKKKPKKPLTSFKKKAWKAFRDWIILRDALSTTKTPYEVICCTCKKKFPVKGMQAGHYVAGRKNAYLFSEQGVHAQCKSCNIFLHGNPIEYREFMDNKYGITERLLEENKRWETKIYIQQDYIDIEQKYKEKLKELKK